MRGTASTPNTATESIWRTHGEGRGYYDEEAAGSGQSHCGVVGIRILRRHPNTVSIGMKSRRPQSFRFFAFGRTYSARATKRTKKLYRSALTLHSIASEQGREPDKSKG